MREKQKVLIAYATAGIGHKKAAIASGQGFEKESNKYDVKIIDMLDYMNDFFKKNYPDGYLLFVNKLIFIWRILYYVLDIKLVHKITYPLRRLIHVASSRNLIKFILEYKPDIVVCTHFIMEDVCSHIKRKYKLDFVVTTVITDFRAHAFWIADDVDLYCVAHKDTKNDLVDKWNIDPAKIAITGIPIEMKFAIEHDRAFVRKLLELPEKNYAILMMSGGYGMGPLFEVLKLLNDINLRLSIIVVCGHNKQLFNQIDDFQKTSRIHVVNMGYVDNIDEIMAAADLYIGKAGGISTSEALASDLPIIFVNPIPGQESRNANFIIKNGAGIICRNFCDIAEVVKEIKLSPDKIADMNKAVASIRKPNAAIDIVRKIAEVQKMKAKANTTEIPARP